MDVEAVLGELRELLADLLPDGWAAAVEAGDEATVRRLRGSLDGPACVAALGAAGWVAPHWEPRHGGRGTSVEAARAVLDLLEDWSVPHVPIGSGLPLAAPTILEWSSEETKEFFLPRMVTGEHRWSQLFSEPGAGSDLASLATSAVRDGDEWIVNGQKVWTTLGHLTNFAMLLTRTDPDAPKHRGITYFGLDLTSPGVEMRPLVNMAGQHEFNEVFLTDVRVPDLHRISPVDDGWAATLTTLTAERYALSGSRKKRRSGDSILGGKTLDEVLALAAASGAGAHPVLRDRLARAYTDDRLLRWTVGRARTDSALGSMLKVLKAESNQSLQLVALAVRGAAGQAWQAADEGAATWATQMLRTRANSIEGGTSEIQRNIIGERVLGLPREPDQFKGQAWRAVPRS